MESENTVTSFLIYHSQLRICLIFETSFKVLLGVFTIHCLYIFYYLNYLNFPQITFSGNF